MILEAGTTCLYYKPKQKEYVENCPVQGSISQSLADQIANECEAFLD